MARFKDAQWNLQGNDSDKIVSIDRIQCALLMDLRDELKKLNALLHCSNFQQIPRVLRSIRRNTYKKRKTTPKRVTRRKR